MRLCAIAVLAGTTALGLSSMQARADDGLDVSKLQACQSITSDIGRLSCFDELAKQAQAETVKSNAAAAPSSPKESSAGTDAQPAASANAGAASAPSATGTGEEGAWLHKEETDGLDNSKIETAILPATTGNVGLINKPGLRRNPALIIRCKEKQTSVFISFDLPVTTSADSVPVQYRIGDTEPKAGAWSRSQDESAYGFWDSARAVALVHQLENKKDFFVRATPQGRSQSEAGFQLAGLETAIQPVRTACGW